MTLRGRLAKLEARRGGAANREPEMSRDEILSLAARLGIDGETLLADPEYQESLMRELGMVAAAMQPGPANIDEIQALQRQADRHRGRTSAREWVEARPGHPTSKPALPTQRPAYGVWR